MSNLSGGNWLIWLGVYLAASFAAPVLLWLLRYIPFWLVQGAKSIKLRVPPPVEHADPNELRSRALRILNHERAKVPVDGIRDPEYPGVQDQSAKPELAPIHLAVAEDADAPNFTIRQDRSGDKLALVTRIFGAIGKRALWPTPGKDLVRVSLQEYRMLEEPTSEFYWQKHKKGWRVLPPGRFTFLHTGPLYSSAYWWLAVPAMLVGWIAQFFYFIPQVDNHEKLMPLSPELLDQVTQWSMILIKYAPFFAFLAIPILANIIVNVRIRAICKEPPYLSPSHVKMLTELRIEWQRYGFDDTGRRNTGMHVWLVGFAPLIKLLATASIGLMVYVLHTKGRAQNEWWTYAALFMPLSPLIVLDMWLSAFFPQIYSADVGIHDRTADDSVYSPGDAVDRLFTELNNTHKVRSKSLYVNPSSDVELSDTEKEFGMEEYISAINGGEGVPERRSLLKHDSMDVKATTQEAEIRTFDAIAENGKPAGWQIEMMEQWKLGKDTFLGVLPGGGKSSALAWLSILAHQERGHHTLLLAPGARDAESLAKILTNTVETLGIGWSLKVSLFTRSYLDREVERLRGGIAIDRFSPPGIIVSDIDALRDVLLAETYLKPLDLFAKGFLSRLGLIGIDNFELLRGVAPSHLYYLLRRLEEATAECALRPVRYAVASVPGSKHLELAAARMTGRELVSIVEKEPKLSVARLFFIKRPKETLLEGAQYNPISAQQRQSMLALEATKKFKIQVAVNEIDESEVRSEVISDKQAGRLSEIEPHARPAEAVLSMIDGTCYAEPLGIFRPLRVGWRVSAEKTKAVAVFPSRNVEAGWFRVASDEARLIEEQRREQALDRLKEAKTAKEEKAPEKPDAKAKPSKEIKQAVGPTEPDVDGDRLAASMISRYRPLLKLRAIPLNPRSTEIVRFHAEDRLLQGVSMQHKSPQALNEAFDALGKVEGKIEKVWSIEGDRPWHTVLSREQEIVDTRKIVPPGALNAMPNRIIAVVNIDHTSGSAIVGYALNDFGLFEYYEGQVVRFNRVFYRVTRCLRDRVELQRTNDRFFTKPLWKLAQSDELPDPASRDADKIQLSSSLDGSEDLVDLHKKLGVTITQIKVGLNVEQLGYQELLDGVSASKEVHFSSPRSYEAISRAVRITNDSRSTDDWNLLLERLRFTLPYRHGPEWGALRPEILKLSDAAILVVDPCPEGSGVLDYYNYESVDEVLSISLKQEPLIPQVAEEKEDPEQTEMTAAKDTQDPKETNEPKEPVTGEQKTGDAAPPPLPEVEVATTAPKRKRFSMPKGFSKLVDFEKKLAEKAKKFLKRDAA